MSWRRTQREAREQTLQKLDREEAERYAAYAAAQDPRAQLLELRSAVAIEPGMRVLDVGAGAGLLCRALALVPGIELTALEPSEAMRATLQDVRAVAGFCDSADDRTLFAPASFDLIVSRAVANGLHDPLAAFANWFHWLAPGGAALVIDALHQPSDWAGRWADEVDSLPLSAVQTTALIPYLLEATGFAIEGVTWLEGVPGRVPRFAVVGRKCAQA